MKLFFKQYWFLILLILLYSLYFSAYTIIRYNNYQASFFDLGHMNNILWNSIHGNIFRISDYNGLKSLAPRLTDHADFTLLLLIPIYVFFQNSITILIAQAVLVSIGIIPIYFFAQRIFRNSFLANLFALLYLLMPGVENATRYEFHAMTVAATFLLFGFYFLYIKKYLAAAIFLTLVLLSKEEIGVTIALLLLVFLCKELREDKHVYKTIKQTWKERHKVYEAYILCILISTLYSFIIIHIIIPLSRVGAPSSYLSAYLGSSGGVSGILRYTITHFFSIISMHFPGDGAYALKLTLSTGFFSFFAPITLIIALPEFLLDILSTKNDLYSILFQYSALINPIILLTSIQGFYFLLRIGKKHYKTLVIIGSIYLISCSFLSALLWGVLPFSKDYLQNVLPRYDAQDTLELEKLEASIPISAVVSASHNIITHFSGRTYAYQYPNADTWADYLIIDKDEDSNMTIPDTYKQIYSGDIVIVYKQN